MQHQSCFAILLGEINVNKKKVRIKIPNQSAIFSHFKACIHGVKPLHFRTDLILCDDPFKHQDIEHWTELEFLKSLWGLGTEEE
jgi:hypothetical protein